MRWNTIETKTGEPFKAYKGFNKNLECKNEKFVIGEVYEKPYKDRLAMCSGDGYHYCNKLSDVFSYYARNNSNRFCEIEVMGPYINYGNKSMTTKFKILRELTVEDFRKFDEEKIENNLHLDAVRELQTAYPLMHVGGSVGLFLHGMYLKRWALKGKSDIDATLPFYMKIDKTETYLLDYDNSEYKNSGNDFDESVKLFKKNEKGYYSSINIDIKVDPHQKYEIIEYKGFKYKVSLLETIMEAKIRYSLQKGGAKHRYDIYELLGKKVK